MSDRKRRYTGRLTDERGAVAVIVALLMVVLVGMTALVVDVGQMYLVRRQMVNAADAAALAGAQELAMGNAAGVPGVGTLYALDNGSESALTAVEVNGPRVEASTGANVEYGFARIFGLTDGDVRARAVAIVGAVGAMEGLRPIMFLEEEYQAALDDPNTVLLGKHEVGPGNWGAMSFAGTGGTFFNPGNFAEHLENGWGPPVALHDDDAYSNSGLAVFKNKKPDEAMQSLVGKDIYVPIVRGKTNGTKWIDVIGFAKIHVVEWVPPKGNKDPQLFIRFVETVVTDAFVNPEAGDFGLVTWDLIE